MMQLSPRQVHLDFHTSPDIEGIAASFDAEAFARTVKDAHISSMTVFARCHHGMLYYDSQKFPERVHPHLARRDLMVEQVKALHAVGVRAPVYITVQWDWYTANERPEWLVREANGAHEGSPFSQPGFYQSLCVNGGYRDFLFAHTREVMALLGDELDGLFFDIVGIRPCLCATCRAGMAREGIDMNDETAVRAYAARALDRFKADMSALVRAHNPSATIFYNAGHVGPSTRASRDAFSHFELESLPSGGWGYLHFPATARYARTLGLDCMGMTGKFHTSWGDFHSLKNAAALEFECFRMLAYGFAASIGDQLEPMGALNPATYRLIGPVYERYEACEPWGRPAKALVEAALVTGEDLLHEHDIPGAVLGACQMLEELALQFDIVDRTQDLSPYKLVILPEGLHIDEAYRDAIDAYVAAGGRILALGDGGLCEGGLPDCYGVAYAGRTPKHPDFIVAHGALAQGLEPDNEYVVYLQGHDLRATTATTVLQARAPYFNREGQHFCSHRYTPSAHGDMYGVGFRNGDVIVLSHPLFEQYRDCAPRWCKTIVANALDALLPDRIVRHDGPSTLSATVLAQPELGRTNVHLLSYIPVRKSATIDIVEERTQARDVTLTLAHAPTAARLVPEGTPLAVEGNRVTVPVIDGYAIVELT